MYVTRISIVVINTILITSKSSNLHENSDSKANMNYDFVEFMIPNLRNQVKNTNGKSRGARETEKFDRF